MYWWIIPLVFYGILNLMWAVGMIKDILSDIDHINTPREYAQAFGCNLFGGIVLYTIDFLLFPLWNVLRLIYKFFYWLFHIGMNNDRVD